MKKILIIILIFVLGFGTYLIFNPDKYYSLQKYIPKEIAVKVRDFGCKYFSKGTPVDKIAYLNTNDESNVALVVKASGNETLVGFRKNGELKTLTIHTNDGKVAVVELNNQKLPVHFEFDGNSATFENYTNSTVDITVNYRDGTTQEFKKSKIIPGKKLGLIPTAYAIETKGIVHETGIAVNVLGCGMGLGSLFVSAGATSPVALLGCGALVTRIVTWDTEIGNCKGDIVECATNLVIKGEALNASLETFDEIYGAVFPSGVRLKGVFRNTITETPIKIGTLEAQSSHKTIWGEWASNGAYEILFKNGGIYTLSVTAEGFKPSNFKVLLSNTQFQILTPGGGKIFPRAQILRDKSFQEIEAGLCLNPDAFIRGEIIDSEQGMPVKNAGIVLFNNDGKNVNEMETESDGIFVVQPSISPLSYSLTLQVFADKYKTQNIPILISYEVKDKSNDYEIKNWNGIVKLELEEESKLKVEKEQEQKVKTDIEEKTKLTPESEQLEQEEPIVEPEEIKENDFSGIWEAKMVRTTPIETYPTERYGDYQKVYNEICSRTTYIFRVYKSPHPRGLYKYRPTEQYPSGGFAGGGINENGNFFPTKELGYMKNWEGKLSGNLGEGTWHCRAEGKDTNVYGSCSGTWTATKKQ